MRCETHAISPFDREARGSQTGRPPAANSGTKGHLSFDQTCASIILGEEIIQTGSSLDTIMEFRFEVPPRNMH